MACVQVSGTFSIGSGHGDVVVTAGVAEAAIGAVTLMTNVFGDIAATVVIVVITPGHDIGALVTNGDVNTNIDNVRCGAGSLSGVTMFVGIVTGVSVTLAAAVAVNVVG